MRIRQRNWREAVLMVMKDLSLFSSFCIARFIVWRHGLRERRTDQSLGVLLERGGLSPHSKAELN